VAPEQFEPILEHLKAAGLNKAPDGAWARAIVEKPFGTDLASARHLNEIVRAAFPEKDTYRIDHFLGKETAQNILVLRFANAIFEPLWNTRYIDHVQITAAETLGVEGRAGYYEGAGALRDMVQNHLLQLLCLVAMEPPTDLSADSIRDEKVKVVRSLRRYSSAEVAESAKLLENIFRAVNIALVNEMKTVLQDMDIDVWEVVKAASTKPFGFMPFYPGPGLGGHCIPIDPYYLTWKAKEVGRNTRFIELAGEVNSSMPRYVVGRLTLALNAQGKAVRGSKVLVVGLAYKPDIDDVRESPSFELIKLLAELGADVAYHDPLVPRTKAGRKHDLGMTSVALTPEGLAGFDAVLISTNHSNVDYAAIAAHAPLVVDTRNALAKHAEGMGKRLWKA
jgi:hypothetical protein